MKSGIELIADERKDQIERFGFTGEHHAGHPEWYSEEQLIKAASMLSYYDANDFSHIYRDMVPKNWDEGWWHKMCDKSKVKRFAIAASLIAAEIDRINALNPTEVK